MHRVILLCVALACALVYVKRTEAFGDLSPDLPYAETVEKERALDDMVDELLMGLLEEEKELSAERAVSEKKRINMLVLGHIASGGDSTFDWLMAKLGARRDGDTNLWKFETLKYVVDVLEGPGSTEFMRKMITIRDRPVDFAVLLTRASTGDFEADVAASGLTRQHASLAHKLCITRLAVAVNKMDSTEPKYSEARFSEVKQEMMKLLQTVGFDPKTVAFVPIALPDADNIMEASSRSIQKVAETALRVVHEDKELKLHVIGLRDDFTIHNFLNQMPWYKGWSVERKVDTIVGKTLVDALDALTSCTPPYDKPLRVPLSDVYKVPGKGVWPEGRVEYGVLRPGMTVTFNPGGLTTVITDLEQYHEHCEEVLAASDGPVTKIRVQHLSTKELKRGMLMGEANNDPPKEAVNFKALVLIVHSPREIRAGYVAVMTCHTAYGPCLFEEIHEKIDMVTGETLERNPQALKAGDVALVTLKAASATRPFSVEAFSDYPNLGRFAMHEQKALSAVGIIQSVVKKDGIGGKVTKVAQKSG